MSAAYNIFSWIGICSLSVLGPSHRWYLVLNVAVNLFPLRVASKASIAGGEMGINDRGSHCILNGPWSWCITFFSSTSNDALPIFWRWWCITQAWPLGGNALRLRICLSFGDALRIFLTLAVMHYKPVMHYLLSDSCRCHWCITMPFLTVMHHSAVP
jgi:hypothetical protein